MALCEANISAALLGYCILLNKSYSDHDKKFEDIDNSNNCPQVGEVKPIIIQFLTLRLHA
jgi:hypothetical protein